MFVSNDSKPHDINATVREAVTVTCRAHARPAPRILWYRNAMPLSGICHCQYGPDYQVVVCGIGLS